MASDYNIYRHVYCNGLSFTDPSGLDDKEGGIWVDPFSGKGGYTRKFNDGTELGKWISEVELTGKVDNGNGHFSGKVGTPIGSIEYEISIIGGIVSVKKGSFLLDGGTYTNPVTGGSINTHGGIDYDQATGKTNARVGAWEVITLPYLGDITIGGDVIYNGNKWHFEPTLKLPF